MSPVMRTRSLLVMVGAFSLSACGGKDGLRSPGVDGGNGSGVGSNPTGCGQGEFNFCDAGALPPTPLLCQGQNDINTEPDILAGYEPADGQSVDFNGQIKVWVTDERPEIIATNEQIDPNTGAITMPGDRTATAPDGYLWEPAVYIAPQSAENGGTPHFPTAIKGDYDNQPGMYAMASGPAPDLPPGATSMPGGFNTEVIWDVSSLGLSLGTYIAEFMIHDGDRDRAVGCVTISITGAP
jgi:hypothetical protein